MQRACDCNLIGETRPRTKVVYYEPLPEWGRLLAGGAYDDELRHDGIVLRNITLGAALAMMVILSALLYLMTRRLVARPLQTAMRVFGRIGEGHYDNRITTDRRDEIGALLRALDAMQTSLATRTEADARTANEALRIKRALDKASTNMMVADKDGTIVYMNDAVTAMMRSAEDAMRQDLPGFRADGLLGSHFEAQRSAEAATEIKRLISDSVARVDGGVTLAKEAGQSMHEIVASFQQVAGLVTEIADASREQSTGIAQVSEAVMQMDDVTQQNAALVAEAAAAAKSLEEQARTLAGTVAVFKVERDLAPGPASARTVARPSNAAFAPGEASTATRAKPAMMRRLPAPAVSSVEDEWEHF
ncbi:methyl-accepting chemotaxis protein [Halochromatium glycolicum]|uniref:methyl-accepting chemotaxis protein n=1 Tax=Halochromatium glycolicum TaxID=85075 RepID=UPI0030B82938